MVRSSTTSFDVVVVVGVGVGVALVIGLGAVVGWLMTGDGCGVVVTWTLAIAAGWPAVVPESAPHPTASTPTAAISAARMNDTVFPPTRRRFPPAAGLSAPGRPGRILICTTIP